MVRISRQEVQKLAQLAYLDLSPAELQSYRADIGSILEFVDQLKQLDLTDYQPTEQVNQLQDVSRSDQLQLLPPPAKLLQNSPKTDGKLIKLQRVLE